jgi:hypothetical protein
LRGERARQDTLQAALDRAARSASASASSFGSGAGDDDDLEDAVSASQTLPARIDVPKTLSVTWLPSTSNSAAASIPSALASLNLTSLLGSDLDVERVLRHVTALHARDVIERLSKVILAAPTPGSGDEAKKHGRQPRSRLVYPSSRRRRRRPGGLAGSDTKNKEDEEEDPVDVVVPYLHLPLVGAHAIGAHIDPLTGRFDLRAAPAIAPDAANLEGRVDLADDEDGGATAEADGGSSARDQRLRLASERIDRERFGPAVVGVPKGVKQQQQQQQQGDPDAWMKGLVEVVARIRASVRSLLLSTDAYERATLISVRMADHHRRARYAPLAPLAPALFGSSPSTPPPAPRTRQTGSQRLGRSRSRRVPLCPLAGG